MGSGENAKVLHDRFIYWREKDFQHLCNPCDNSYCPYKHYLTQDLRLWPLLNFVSSEPSIVFFLLCFTLLSCYVTSSSSHHGLMTRYCLLGFSVRDHNSCSMVPSIMTSYPGPEAAKHSHTTMLPPPCYINW